MIRGLTECDRETALETTGDRGPFTPEELDALGVRLRAFLADASDPDESWIAEFDDELAAVGVALCTAKPMTDRVWNLLFIGVRAGQQDRVVGGALMRYVEKGLLAASQRMLVIDTSKGPGFAAVHAFYRSHG